MNASDILNGLYEIGLNSINLNKKFAVDLKASFA